MTRTIFALLALALALPGCFLPAAPCGAHDAGSSDAYEAPMISPRSTVIALARWIAA